MTSEELSRDEVAYEAFLQAARSEQSISVDAFLRQHSGTSDELRVQLEKLARALPARARRADLGPYEPLERLGAGGMGEVWRARDSESERIVAVKRLAAGFGSSPAHVERFRREARLLAKLDHPGIARIVALRNATDGARLLVMECVEGDDLGRILARGPLDSERACRIALGIARALEAAHAAGVVHRDLKPSNVMLTNDDVVKLLDFGLGKHIDGGTVGLTGEGERLGTPGYMSPEQALGLAIDERTDVFAFGCVFFELVSGERAVDDQLAGDFDTARMPSSLPGGVDALIERCLAGDAAVRPAHMGLVRSELEALLPRE